MYMYSNVIGRYSIDGFTEYIHLYIFLFGLISSHHNQPPQPKSTITGPEPVEVSDGGMYVEDGRV